MSNPSLLCVPYRFKTSKLYSQIPDSGLGDFVVTRSASNSATRVNAAGLIETVADNVPRLDYPLGGISAGCPALLVEPAATNGIRNNSMVGAVVGSPGTMPTNWAESLNGLVRQSVALGTENGVSYIDIRYSGTASGSSAAVLFETATQIVASTGQTWSNSVYLKIIAQPNPPIAYRLSMWEYNTSGTVFGGSFATAVVPTTTSLQRFTQTRALTGATTDRIRPLFDVSMTSGQSYDFTIRIGYPQMELGSVATSVIPTTTAAITRGAETISKTGVSSLIGQTEGTIYAEVDLTNLAQGSDVYIITQLFLNGSNRMGILTRKNGADDIIEGYVLLLGGFVAEIRTNDISPGIFKVAFAYKLNDFVMYVNGSLIGSDTSGGVVAANQIQLGHNNGSGQLNNRIRALELYPTRLPNTGPLSLQSLTQ